VDSLYVGSSRRQNEPWRQIFSQAVFGVTISWTIERPARSVRNVLGKIGIHTLTAATDAVSSVAGDCWIRSLSTSDSRV
jgi:hypothetical protein